MTERTREKAAPATKKRVPTIIGDRVLLRAPRRQDQAEFLALNRASVAFHRRLVSPPVATAQYADYLTRCGRDDCRCFMVCRRADRSIIGAINLSQIFRGAFENAYLGYQIGAAYANQGYMSEALRLVLRYAFEELQLHRLEANIQPGNIASIAMVRRAGFVREGFSRHYLKIDGR